MIDKDYFKNYYSNHREQILSGQTTRWKLAQAYLASQKSKPCMDCGFIPTVPDQMDFDHVRGEKKLPLAVLAGRGGSIQKIQDEIDKCDLVCANCHRLRTYNRRKNKEL